MTNLLISYPDILLTGTPLLEQTAASTSNTRNIVTGQRCSLFTASAAVTQSRWVYDFGSDVKPDHLLIARADFLRRNDSAATTWRVEGSASSAMTSPEVKTGTFNLTDLSGPRDEDLLVTFSYASAFRYWAIQINTTTAFAHSFSKAQLGRFLDLQRDPLIDLSQRRDTEEPGVRATPYRFDLKWEGLTDAKRAEFTDLVTKNSDACPVFLSETVPLVLRDCGIIHCQLTDFSFDSISRNCNNLSATFQELI